MPPLKPKTFRSLLIDSGRGLSRDFGGVHAAALGYYIILSIFPLTTLSAILITRMVGPAALSGNFESMLSSVVGVQYSKLLMTLITDSYSTATHTVWTLLNILVLIYASSYMFYQARISMDALWHLTPKPGVTNSLLATVKTYALAYIIALMVGLSFLALLFLNTAWNLFSNILMNRLTLNLIAVQPLVDFVTSPIIYTLIFLVAFRYLPQANASLVDLLPGAGLTAILYWIGNYLYAVYLGMGAVNNLYGIASSLVLFLFWVYYSAMIFLFGAKFTGLYAARFGKGLMPHSNMRIVDPL